MKKLVVAIILFFGLEAGLKSQNPGYLFDAPDYDYGKFMTVKSDTMNRELPILVFTPKEYEKTNRKYPVVYMLHGTSDLPLTEEGLRKMYNPATRINEMAEMFQVIIVTPLVGISYYLDSPLKPEHRFASYVGTELPVFVDNHFRTQANREGRILCGFSMGGYGSASLLCRYPDTFSIALERAGVLSLSTFIDDLYWDEIGGNLTSLLGNYFDNNQNYHQNSCFNLVNHIKDRKDIAFVIEVGKEDFLYKTNHQFHLWLNELGVPHIYNETEGGHQWGANQLRSLLANLQYFRQTQFE